MCLSLDITKLRCYCNKKNYTMSMLIIRDYLEELIISYYANKLLNFQHVNLIKILQSLG